MPLIGPIRNPYPIPDVSSEGFWLPPGPVLGERVQLTDKYWSTKVRPHERLFAHHTLNSIRKDHRLVRTKAPEDSLDLALSATYVHNEDTLVPKMYVNIQPESLGVETWRVLRNEVKEMPPPFGIPTSFKEFIESRIQTGDKSFKNYIGSQIQDDESIKEYIDSWGESEAGMDSEKRDRVKRKMAPETKRAAKAKMTATRAKTTAGAQTGSRGKTVPAGKSAGAVKTSGNSSMPARRQVAEGSRRKSTSGMAGTSRAKTAPPNFFYEVESGGLHKYAGGTQYVGIPDRIERIHHSVLKLSIDGPHSEQTRSGYSRKEDGTFYGV